MLAAYLNLASGRIRASDNVARGLDSQCAWRRITTPVWGLLSRVEACKDTISDSEQSNWWATLGETLSAAQAAWSGAPDSTVNARQASRQQRR
jgi:hypothetical protein